VTNIDIFFSCDPLQFVAVFLLYAGPDQFLPLVSILGTIIGVLLIWWRRFVMLIRKVWRILSRKPQEVVAEPSAKIEAIEATANIESPVKEQI
jgi:hypothetical protein